MKFKVEYKVGSSVRQKFIIGKNLDDAEEIANSKFENWTDIVYVDKTKAKEAYRQ